MKTIKITQKLYNKCKIDGFIKILGKGYEKIIIEFDEIEDKLNQSIFIFNMSDLDRFVYKNRNKGNYNSNNTLYIIADKQPKIIYVNEVVTHNFDVNFYVSSESSNRYNHKFVL